MKSKTVISAVLLLFVVVSIVALIAKQSGESPAASTESATGDEAANTPLLEDRVIVYYFHGNARCPTCLTLEEYSKETVETFFANDLQSGRVQWQVINFDETWNEHFLTDYDLSFQSLVLVEIKDGKEVRHTNLEEIWDLVGDKPAYFEYVRGEIDVYVTGK